jgi:hypothetical protein
MKWIFESARVAFNRYRKDWERVNKRSGNHILLDPGFVELLVAHFATERTLLAAPKEGEEAALLLLEPGRHGLWHTFQPSQAPLGLVLFPAKESSGTDIQEIICHLPGYALGLSIMQQDSELSQLTAVAGTGLERVEYITTSRTMINGTFEEYWRTRTHNLTHNLARQRRRFKQQNMSLQLFTNRAAEAMEQELTVYGRLESSGWKGKEGTAIAADNVQGAFYRKILEYFSGQQEAVTYRLDLHGRPIASALCLERAATLIVLKITYDENMPRCSPGLLLHEEMLKAIFNEKRVRVIEYYGQYTDWHRKWTSDIRGMYHLNFYRYGWIKTTRHILKAVAASLGTPSPTKARNARLGTVPTTSGPQP